MTAPPPLALVADDDAACRRGLALVLSADGYNVVEASDGEHALELLAAAADGKAAQPDVLILDFCMPGLSGLGILRIIRRFGRVPPTILVTGFRDASVDTFARGFGAIAVLHKPLDLEDLHQALQRARAAT